MPQTYKVIVRVLHVRSEPDSVTGNVLFSIPKDQSFQVQHVFTKGTETWARLPEYGFACLGVGAMIFARADEPKPQPPSGDLFLWILAVDEYLREIGYAGPHP